MAKTIIYAKKLEMVNCHCKLSKAEADLEQAKAELEEVKNELETTKAELAECQASLPKTLDFSIGAFAMNVLSGAGVFYSLSANATAKPFMGTYAFSKGVVNNIELYMVVDNNRGREEYILFTDFEVINDEGVIRFPNGAGVSSQRVLGWVIKDKDTGEEVRDVKYSLDPVAPAP